jgi:hypothetical protein
VLKESQLQLRRLLHYGKYLGGPLHCLTLSLAQPGMCGSTVMSMLTLQCPPQHGVRQSRTNLLAKNTSCTHPIQVPPDHHASPIHPVKASTGLAAHTMAAVCLQPQAACVAQLLQHSQHASCRGLQHLSRRGDAKCKPTSSARQQWLLRCRAAKHATLYCTSCGIRHTPHLPWTGRMPAPSQHAFGGLHARFNTQVRSWSGDMPIRQEASTAQLQRPHFLLFFTH